VHMPLTVSCTDWVLPTPGPEATMSHSDPRHCNMPNPWTGAGNLDTLYYLGNHAYMSNNNWLVATFNASDKHLPYSPTDAEHLHTVHTKAVELQGWGSDCLVGGKD
jgi:hypothetical protein